MADLVYNQFKEYSMDGTIDVDNDTFKLGLLDDTYTPAATHATWGEISGDEVSATNYTTGGTTLGSVTWTLSGATCTFDAADCAWAAVSFTARYGVIYDTTPAAPTNPLVCLIDFTENKTVSAATFTIQFNSGGIFTLA